MRESYANSVRIWAEHANVTLIVYGFGLRRSFCGPGVFSLGSTFSSKAIIRDTFERSTRFRTLYM
jgi:Leu/Phe-tRNA-protein transferase